MNDSQPFDKASPVADPELTEVANRDWWGEWRNYNVPPEESDSHNYISEWIALEEGEYYRMEGYFMEFNGSDFFTVSVEYEQEDTEGHHHSSKEVQVLTYLTDNEPEIFEIYVDGQPTGSTY